MSWKKVETNIIEHTEGYKITLLSGSWKVPMDIDTFFPRDLDAYTVATLIRKGLDFAHSSPIASHTVKPAPKKPLKKKNPGRPILTLKKK